LRSGKVFDGHHLRIVYVLRREKTTQILLGFVVPKRYAGGVPRNRAKRLIREAWRMSLRPYVRVLRDAQLHLSAVTLVGKSMPRPGELTLAPLCSDLEEFVGRVLMNLGPK
jgi:hypothetical protein